VQAVAVLQWGLVLFLGAFLIHLLIWRLHKPEASLKVLLAIFLVVIVAGLAALYFGRNAIYSIGLAGLPNAAAYLHVLVFSVSMALAYIVIYTLIEWDSPTLTIVNMIARAGKRGVGTAKLVKLAENLPSIESRMQSLIRSNVIVEKDGRYVVSPGRHIFYRSVLYYSRLLRADDTQSG
jgi:hypothetical protein